MEDLITNQEHEEEISYGFFIFLILMFTSLFTSHMLKRCGIESFHVPEIATILSFFVGLFLHFVFNINPVLEHVLTMNDDVFFLLLLPPIIFDSGLSIRGKQGHSFFANSGSIMWFAFFCTTLSVIFVGMGMAIGAFTGSINPISFREAFAFASLISSTDPIAVLAVLKDLGAASHLSAIIGGESLLNDAVAIILYKSVTATEIKLSSKSMPTQKNSSSSTTLPPVSFTKRSHEAHYELLLLLLEFSGVFMGSVLCGFIVGALGSFLLKRMALREDRHENRLLEASLLFLFPWIAYVSAESVQCSGVVAVLFSAVCLTTYGVPNLSETGKSTVRGVFSLIGFMAETAVFVFLGLAFSSFDITWSVHSSFIIVAVFVVFFSRFLSVRITTSIVNKFRTKVLPANEEMLISLGGLRGAVAFALSLRARRDFTLVNEGGRGKNVGDSILSATLVLAGASTVILGPLMKPIGAALNISTTTLSSALSSSPASHSEENAPLRETTRGEKRRRESSLQTQSSQQQQRGYQRNHQSHLHGESNEWEEDNEEEEENGCFKRVFVWIHYKILLPVLTNSADSWDEELAKRPLSPADGNVRQLLAIQNLGTVGENDEKMASRKRSSMIEARNELEEASFGEENDSMINEHHHSNNESTWGEGRADAYRSTLMKDKENTA